MHKEFAIDPQAIAQDWQTFRYCIEKFGFSKGRLISRFPKKWERQVIEAADAAGIRDTHRLRLVEKLRHAKENALIRTGRSFANDVASWLDSALASHNEKQFHAILTASNSEQSSAVTSLDDLDEHTAPLYVETSKDVPRTADALAEVFSPLLLCSDRATLIDPYFDPEKPRYLAFLDGLLSKIRGEGCTSFTLNIHCAEHDRRNNYAEQKREAERRILPLLSPGFQLSITYWREKPGGEDFHDRFLITPHGGITIGAGFSAEGAHETANVALMEDAHAMGVMKRFSVDAAVYQKMEYGIVLSA